jgi:HEAT repeat protein
MRVWHMSAFWLTAFTVFGFLWLDEPGESVEHLCRELKANSVVARRAAATELGKMGSKARASVPALVEALDDPDYATCAEATRALQAIGSFAVRGLVDALKNSREQTRNRIIYILGEIGPDAKAAVTPLVDLMVVDNTDTLTLTVDSLVRIDPTNRTAISYLVTGLRSPAKDKRLWAAENLARARAEARSAIPVLLEILEENPPANDREYAYRVARAIVGMWRYGPLAKVDRHSLDFVFKKFNIPNTQMRVPMAVAVLRIDPWHKEARQALREDMKILLAMINDTNKPTVTAMAASALGCLGVREALPELQGALKHKDPEVRGVAREAIDRILLEN